MLLAGLLNPRSIAVFPHDNTRGISEVTLQGHHVQTRCSRAPVQECMHAVLFSCSATVSAPPVGAMAKPASVQDLHLCWLKDRSIVSRVDQGGRLFHSRDGLFAEASEMHCVENRAILHPYMIRMRRARSLDIPDLESLKSELMLLHQCRLNQKQKNGKKPQALLQASLELVQGNVHLDGKTLKRLLSYARHRFLKIKNGNMSSIKETLLQYK